MRLYAIGDIHGQLELLKAAHRRIFDDGGPDAPIAHVGDLIDRGPDSRGVVDYLLRGRDAGRPWVVMRGNHDRFLPAFIDRPDWIDPGLSSRQHWVDHPGLGAAATLQSYDIDPDQPRDALLEATRAAVPRAHADFLASLPLWFLHPLALIVHAGVRPGIDLRDQAEDDLVWIRKPFLESDADFGPLLVHGHTALERPALYRNRLNLDGGAAYGRPLSSVVIEDGAVHLLTDEGRVPMQEE
ncbi:metallophosphoesterase [Paracoccus beibuensis]|uniref:metallophosphoesterase n=1 Tax=Paracoccus beibuensis TaxID=547602 RepID=UPI00223F60A7|nr:metallophosphoesterase [Paracoccus beibuensis]